VISSVKRVDLYAFLARLHLGNWMTRHWYHEQGDVV